jgi:hypothetical protein
MERLSRGLIEDGRLARGELDLLDPTVAANTARLATGIVHKETIVGLKIIVVVQVVVVGTIGQLTLIGGGFV